MSKNEKITENIVRKKLEAVGITEENGFLIDEQIVQNTFIKNLLPSKKSGSGKGRPEFLISKSGDKDFLIVIECKADTKFHESSNKDQYAAFAVDGVLLYASKLSQERNVIAIAVSGQTKEELKISTFLFLKGSGTYSTLTDTRKILIEDIIPWQDYIRFANYDENLAKSKKSDLNKFSKELHDYIRDYGKITEAQKPLLVSGILLALMEPGFKVAYSKYEEVELAQKTFQAIKDVIDRAELGFNQEKKKDAVINAFSFIKFHPELQKINKKQNESPLARIIKDIDREVRPFTQNYYDYDIIGNFYGEFIRYTGGDKQGLGIVLTPKHITELFADLAKLNKNSVVLDTCCGTGGFLISAMKKMTVGVSETEKNEILKKALIGVEQEPSMFALAVSNMILRGDGKTNLFQGSCFDEDIFNAIKNKATVGFINPPYSQKGEDLHEWNFIIQLLNALQKNATGIVIVPMSLAIAQHPLREQLLKEHRLEAVMSMPNDLFYPVGVVSCIMVFTAHVPHDSDEDHKSWFGYWKDDGFRKDKVQGRIPTERWLNIREDWLKVYRREEISGKSVWKKVNVIDEWTAEAYIKTDYSDFDIVNFKKVVLDYISYNVSIERLSIIKDLTNSHKALTLSRNKWEDFEIKKIFDIKLGNPIHKNTIEVFSENKQKEYLAYVTRTTTNNGIEFYVDRHLVDNLKIIEKNKITIGAEGFKAFYQNQDFITGNKVNILYNKYLNEFSGLFLCAVLNLEIGKKFSYGRGLVKSRLENLIIKLPVDRKGNPDWKFMEDYIKSLPYSGSI